MTILVLRCSSCGSLKLTEVNAEICIHFPGLRGLKTAPIFAFPKLAVCLDCGSVQSNFSTKELELIRNGATEVQGVSA
jgi:hypothetical protein